MSIRFFSLRIDTRALCPQSLLNIVIIEMTEKQRAMQTHLGKQEQRFFKFRDESKIRNTMHNIDKHIQLQCCQAIVPANGSSNSSPLCCRGCLYCVTITKKQRDERKTRRFDGCQDRSASATTLRALNE